MVTGNPNQLFDQMYSSNPQFREFADSMKGKNPEDAFRDNGYDYGQIRSLMGK